MKSMMKVTVTLLAAFVLLSGVAFAGDMLNMTDDERTIERDIAEYLKKAHGFKSTIHKLNSDQNDEYLTTNFTVEGAPDLKFYIDSMPAARDGSERCVRVYADFEYDMTENNPKFAKALEVLNLFMEKKWMPQRVFFRPNGDLRLENYVNIVGPRNPIPTEVIADIIIRNVSSWKSLYKMLRDENIHRI